MGRFPDLSTLHVGDQFLLPSESTISKISKTWKSVGSDLKSIKHGVQEIKGICGAGEKDSFLYTSYIFLDANINGWKELGFQSSSIKSKGDLESILDVISTDNGAGQTIHSKGHENKRKLEQITNKMFFIQHTLHSLVFDFEEKVLPTIFKYCSGYGEYTDVDENLCNSNSSRLVTIKENLHMFQNLMEYLDGNTDLHIVPLDLYCVSGLSLQVSIAFDTEVFPILRILPDLCQKLEEVCVCATEWLKDDKLYIRKIIKETEIVRTNLKSIKERNLFAKFEYDSILADMKGQGQIYPAETKCGPAQDHHVAKIEVINIEKSSNKTKKISKSINSQNTTNGRGQKEFDFITEQIGLAGEIMARSFPMVQHLEEKLEKLKTALKSRTLTGLTRFPPISRRSSLQIGGVETRGDYNKSRRRSQRSADLHKAFHFIKNNIGHNWKDLARYLPYSNSREIIEINNDILSIEYEYPGQLKEQAFQALIRWYMYCGTRVSVKEVCSTLRMLEENWIADNIMDMIGTRDSKSE